MPVGSWWIVNDSLMRIVSGPFLWDGSAMGLTLPQKAVNTDPLVGGYAPAPTADSNAALIAALATRVTTVEARLAAEARGVAQTPAIGLGATVNVPVTLKTPMPNLSYTPTALLIGNAALNNLSIQSAAVGTTQVVNVAVKSTLGITLGAASVLVFADAN